MGAQGRSHWGTRGRYGPLTSSFEPKKDQHFQFQISEILPFTSFQKLYRPNISRFLPCMLQFLDNIHRLLICSNYTG